MGEIFFLGPNLGGVASLGTAAPLLTLVLAWRKRTTATTAIEFWLTLSFLLCLTAVTLLPSQGFQDDVVLLPGIFLVSYRWKELSSTRTYKALLATGTAVPFWPWLAASVLIASKPLSPTGCSTRKQSSLFRFALQRFFHSRYWDCSPWVFNLEFRTRQNRIRVQHDSSTRLQLKICNSHACL